MEVPQHPYVAQHPCTYAGEYQIPINGKTYSILTLVLNGGVVAWMPDNEQQHANPQFKDKELRQPIRVGEINEWIMAQIIQQVLAIKAKRSLPLEYILSEYGELTSQMELDFRLAGAQL
ncbi:hypothetical protein J4206_05295 [Candidatus Woesearchaeota archaeon]|nr:hypothetical protein [Candidatus Woesearchaeota archaeon]